MNTREQLISARIGILALAEELKTTGQPCQVARISRTHFYGIKTAGAVVRSAGEPRSAALPLSRTGYRLLRW